MNSRFYVMKRCKDTGTRAPSSMAVRTGVGSTNPMTGITRATSRMAVHMGVGSTNPMMGRSSTMAIGSAPVMIDIPPHAWAPLGYVMNPVRFYLGYVLSNYSSNLCHS